MFLLRNPEARERLTALRVETIRSLGEFIDKNVARLGATLAMPAETLARVILAVNDGVTLDSHLAEDDVYRAYLQRVMSTISPRTSRSRRMFQRVDHWVRPIYRFSSEPRSSAQRNG